MEKLIIKKGNEDLKEIIEMLKGLDTEQKQLAKGVIIGLQLSERNKAS